MKSILTFFTVAFFCMSYANAALDCSVKKSYLDLNGDTQYKVMKINFIAVNPNFPDKKTGFFNYPNDKKPDFSIIVTPRNSGWSEKNEVMIATNDYSIVLKFDLELEVGIGLPGSRNFEDDYLTCKSN